MNGVHDMGGMHGFGPLPVEEDEPVFHEEWEGRVFAINWAALAAAGSGLDAGRAAIEQIPPQDYLSLPYFGRWYSALCTSFVGSGLVSEQQMAAIQAGKRADVPGPLFDTEKQAATLAMDVALSGSPPWRDISTPPQFEIGQQVRAKVLHVATHTRLPRYVRGRRGRVVADRGGHVYPDSNAIGLGEDPHRLYAVEFAARELWGDKANSNDSVTLDLWEPYLEAT